LKRAVNRATVGNLHHSLPLIGVKGTGDFNLPLDLIQYRRSRAGTAAEPTAAAATSSNYLYYAACPFYGAPLFRSTPFF